VKNYLKTPWGKGTLAVAIAGLLTGWPYTLAWLVAAVLGFFALVQFREAFRELDGEPPAPINNGGRGLTTRAVASGGSSPPLDVAAALAACE
jgi:membrane protein implicated in regulation of membrane protease activity